MLSNNLVPIFVCLFENTVATNRELACVLLCFWQVPAEDSKHFLFATPPLPPFPILPTAVNLVENLAAEQFVMIRIKKM